MRARKGSKDSGPLNVQALYSLARLTNLVGLTAQSLHRLLVSNGVQFVFSGRVIQVPLSEIERKIPLLWESMKCAEMLRVAAGARPFDEDDDDT